MLDLLKQSIRTLESIPDVNEEVNNSIFETLDRLKRECCQQDKKIKMFCNDVEMIAEKYFQENNESVFHFLKNGSKLSKDDWEIAAYCLGVPL